jgi:class 3 adenylate cyclase
MLCSKCGSENPPANRFCLECGAALPARCAKCGGEIPPRAKFCGVCGEALEVKVNSAGTAEPSQIEASELVEGERKIVTAVFADIKGSTELSQHLDPEEARALIDPALKLMIQAVRRYDGYVVQSAGDGIFALFGAPTAAEDHPQRALYSALAMQDSIKAYAARLRAEGRVPIELRVGAHTGEVVMRAVKTDENRTEYTAVGHAANLAARMQPLAPVGSIAVTEHLRRLCEGYFQFRSMGEAHVKGVTDTVNVYEVSGLGPLRRRLQIAAERGLTKFAGRQAEIEQMRHALDLAKSGRGQILAAIGEPGIGKSRLFLEFKAIAPKDAMVLEAFSLSHGKASAYLPVIELLRSYFGISDEDDQCKRSEKISGKILALDRSM